ncbi:MAG: hypothetical protein JWQ09_4797, partial [Segetibacter sp.]|nr:hypothetical protein [Segetibacter sp.]
TPYQKANAKKNESGKNGESLKRVVNDFFTNLIILNLSNLTPSSANEVCKL